MGRRAWISAKPSHPPLCYIRITLFNVFSCNKEYNKHLCPVLCPHWRATPKDTLEYLVDPFLDRLEKKITLSMKFFSFCLAPDGYSAFCNMLRYLFQSLTGLNPVGWSLYYLHRTSPLNSRLTFLSLNLDNFILCCTICITFHDNIFPQNPLKINLYLILVSQNYFVVSRGL